MRKSTRRVPLLAGSTSAFDSAPPKWPGTSCHGTRAIWAKKALALAALVFFWSFIHGSPTAPAQGEPQCRNHPPKGKIPFSETCHKHHLWRPHDLESGRCTGDTDGSAPTALLRPHRRERQPVEGFARALHRAAGVEPAARQARR